MTEIPIIKKLVKTYMYQQANCENHFYRIKFP